MDFRAIFISSRRCTVELIDAGIYHTDQEYEIFVDGNSRGVHHHVIYTVQDLKPDTEYKVEVRMRSESVTHTIHTEYEYVTLNVRKFGARGDGVHDDTLAIQAAINCCPKNSRVYIPKGVYKMTSLFLKSDITIDLAKGAELSAFTDRDKFAILPGLIESYDETEEYNLGTWEGNPLEMFSSIITGVNVSNVVITGEGVLNGNADFDNWWYQDGRFKTGGAFRPRMIFLNHCENITVQGITITQSPSWTLHPYFSNNTRWIDLRVRNPKISPNTDGMDPESVKGLEIVGVSFTLGDDCIAMKSGKYYMGHKYKVSSEDIMIRQCCMRYGHGSVTLGSEMAAGVKNMAVQNCIFEGTDRGLRIKTRRGRGEDAVIDNISFENIKMDQVLTPFVLNSYYWCCDPDGHSEYVKCKDPLPVDERTPSVRKMSFRNIEAKNCHVAASFLYGLPEAKVEEIIMENVHVDFAENPTPEYAAMMADVEKTTNQGIYINNVKHLVMKNVTVEGAKGLPMELLNIDDLEQE